MDGAGVTVKEAWVKAKVVCRKKGIQIRIKTVNNFID